jgi:hypothetical protein
MQCAMPQLRPSLCIYIQGYYKSLSPITISNESLNQLGLYP